MIFAKHVFRNAEAVIGIGKYANGVSHRRSLQKHEFGGGGGKWWEIAELLGWRGLGGFGLQELATVEGYTKIILLGDLVDG